MGLRTKTFAAEGKALAVLEKMAWNLRRKHKWQAGLFKDSAVLRAAVGFALEHGMDEEYVERVTFQAGIRAGSKYRF